MNTWIWLGGGAAAVSAIVAILYFAGLGGIVRVFGAVFGFLGDTAQWLRQWLRRPGNKIRAVCLVLAIVAACAALQSWQRGTVIIQQRADFTALKERTDAERVLLLERIADREATIAEFVLLADRQKVLLDRARQENAEVAAEAARQRERAAKSEREFQDVFMKRPPECKAALDVMAAACPSLENY